MMFILKSNKKVTFKRLCLLSFFLLVLACRGKGNERSVNDCIVVQDSIPIPSKTNVDSVKEQDDAFVCVLVDPVASFPGGDQACFEWIEKHLQYPPEAKAQGIQGRVLVQFTVEADGTITDIHALRGPNQQLIDEAIRVVKGMPRWNPAIKNGKAISSRFNLPILFKIHKGH